MICLICTHMPKAMCARGWVHTYQASLCYIYYVCTTNFHGNISKILISHQGICPLLPPFRRAFAPSWKLFAPLDYQGHVGIDKYNKSTNNTLWSTTTCMIKTNAINNLFYTAALGFSFHTFSYNAVKFIVTKFIRLLRLLSPNMIIAT